MNKDMKTLKRVCTYAENGDVKKFTSTYSGALKNEPIITLFAYCGGNPEIINIINKETIFRPQDGLIGACRGGHVEHAKNMIALGAIPDTNCLRTAIAYKQANIVRYLVFEFNIIDITDGFSFAITNNDLELVKQLIALPDRQYNVTEVVHMALKNKHEQIAVYIINQTGHCLSQYEFSLACKGKMTQVAMMCASCYTCLEWTPYYNLAKKHKAQNIMCKLIEQSGFKLDCFVTKIPDKLNVLLALKKQGYVNPSANHINNMEEWHAISTGKYILTHVYDMSPDIVSNIGTYLYIH